MKELKTFMFNEAFIEILGVDADSMKPFAFSRAVGLSVDQQKEIFKSMVMGDMMEKTLHIELAQKNIYIHFLFR